MFQMFSCRLLSFFVFLSLPLRTNALTVLTYNVAGNGTTDWSTNTPQVQAIGRQMTYLQPDIITFVEIPYTNTWQMTNFIKAFLPGYALANNSGTDGFIRSVMASRYPITRSQKWLDGVSLVPFGYTNSPSTFTRDLFESEIAVPGWSNHLHVFTTHLKATESGTNYTNSVLRRAAEASAVSNFLVTSFLPSYGQRPYLLTGDMNEDIAKPPTSGGHSISGHPIERLTSAPTGLRLTTPINPVTSGSNTFSIRSSLSERIDYIMPCGLLFSNISTSQVFRTDKLSPMPAGLATNTSATASDHLPVLMSFYNPYDTTFRFTSITWSNQLLTLAWQTTTGRTYRVEAATDLMSWTAASSNLTAFNTNLSWSVNANTARQFFRVYRLP